MSSSRSYTSWRRNAAISDHNINSFSSTNRNNKSTSSRSNMMNSAGGGGTLLAGVSSKKTTASFRTTRRHRPGEVVPATNGVPLSPLSSTAPATDVPGDLFDFGVSLSVSDDQRRDIHEEIKEIVGSNDRTNKFLLEENKMEEQIKKDLKYSRNEQLKLNEGASDQLESANMYSMFLEKDLKHRFQTHIVDCTTPILAPISTAGKPNSHGSSSVSPDLSPNEINGVNSKSSEKEEKDSNSKSSSSRVSNKIILVEKSNLVNSILQTLQSNDQCMHDTEIEKAGLNEKRIQLEESIELQGLRSSLEREREEVRRYESEVQKSGDAKATRIVEIQQSRDSSGLKAQKITDLTKRLNEAKKSNAEDEAKAIQKIDAAKTEIVHLQKVKEEKTMQLEHHKRKIKECIQQMDAIQAYHKSKEGFNNAAIARAEKKKDLLARQIELKSKLEEQQKKEQASLARKKRTEEAAKIAQAKKDKNVDNESKLAILGKAEMETLAEEKMKVADEIRDASKTIEDAQAQEHQALIAKKDLRKSMNEQIEKLQSDHQATLEETKTTIQEHKTFYDLQEGKIAFNRSSKDDFLEKRKAKEKEFETKYEEQRSRLDQEFQERTNKSTVEHESNSIEVEMFEAGMEMLKCAKQAEDEASDYGRL